MKAVSIREAIGSAAKARVVGSEICIISRPSSSFLRAFLEALENKVSSAFMNSLSNNSSKTRKTPYKLHQNQKGILSSRNIVQGRLLSFF